MKILIEMLLGISLEVIRARLAEGNKKKSVILTKWLIWNPPFGRALLVKTR